MFCLSALVAGTAFFRWRRITDRDGLWQLYGWFTGLSFVGSFFGAFSMATTMQALAHLYNGDLLAYTHWTAAHDVFYGVFTPFMFLAKLTVLDRMSEFSIPKSHPTSKRLFVIGRISFVATIVASTVALGGNIAAAVFAVEVGNFLSAGGASNSTALSSGVSRAETADTVQYYFEVIRLLILVVSFALVGFFCFLRLRSAVRKAALHSGNSSDHRELTIAAATGKKLILQIVVTTSFVFITSVLRASFAVWLASAKSGSNFKECSDAGRTRFFCSSCHNDWQHQVVYELYTPEIYSVVEFISYPVTMLVAIWGMTGDKILRGMRNENQALVDTTMSMKIVTEQARM